MIELVAVSPGGEYFVTRDSNGVVRRHDRFAEGEPLVVGERSLLAALAAQGISALDEFYESWIELEDRVDELLPKEQFNAPTMQVSVELAHHAPRILRTWLVDPAREQLVPLVVARLLREQSVSEDSDLVRELAALLAPRLSQAVNRRSDRKREQSRFELVTDYFLSAA